jgi:Cu+-exporting ATPase
MELDNGRVVLGDDAPAETEQLVRDPVCGMELERANAAGATDYRGHVYYFCSDDCKQRFLAAPARFISPASSP